MITSIPIPQQKIRLPKLNSKFMISAKTVALAAFLLVTQVPAVYGDEYVGDRRMLEERPASEATQGSYLDGQHRTRNLESRYLREARKYRAEGRYELARQSYVQALSVCNSERRLDIIRHELDGIELLLRTMR